MGSDGYEWLTQSALPLLPPARSGAAFVQSDMAGWDECAPTIDSCVVEGITIPDHGDLWDQGWSVSREGGRSIVTTVLGSSLPYRLQRTVVPTPDGIRLDYLAGATHGEVPFLWAAHPQFVSPPGTIVRLPVDVTSVRDARTADAATIDWSAELASIDTVPEGECRKVYVDPDQPVRVATLVHLDGHQLKLSWTDNVPFLGVWFDHRARSRQPVIALEPSTGYYDSLARAIRLGRVPRLRVGKPLEWSLSVACEDFTSV